MKRNVPSGWHRNAFRTPGNPSQPWKQSVGIRSRWTCCIDGRWTQIKRKSFDQQVSARNVFAIIIRFVFNLRGRGETVPGELWAWISKEHPKLEKEARGSLSSDWSCVLCHENVQTKRFRSSFGTFSGDQSAGITYWGKSEEETTGV